MSRTEKALWASAFVFGFALGLIGGGEYLRYQWSRTHV